jgi:TatD DNase family protein
MIDTHCHLEQSDYDRDRSAVVARCRRGLHAVVTSCVHPRNFAHTVQLVTKYRGFVFATASIHPAYVRDVEERGVRDYLTQIASMRHNLVGIGETGLDYNWIQDPQWRERQQHLFVQFIKLGNALQLPLVIHSRDATEDVLRVLQQHAETPIQMHMFTRRSALPQVIDQGWFISVNTLLLQSKTVRKIVRDCPMDRLMLETDAPWLGVGDDRKIKPKDEVRNEPTAVTAVAQKVAEIKKLTIDEVDARTTENAVDFYHLVLA